MPECDQGHSGDWGAGVGDETRKAGGEGGSGRDGKGRLVRVHGWEVQNYGRYRVAGLAAEAAGRPVEANW